jgi:hypothetical protein
MGMKRIKIEELIGAMPTEPVTEPVPEADPTPAPITTEPAPAPLVPEPEPAPTPAAMTKKEKLLRWAELVRDHQANLSLYSNLEYTSERQRRMMMVDDISAFAVAVKDPEFAAQGLSYQSSIHDVLNFFEMDVHEAHVFSCDCGGHIDNKEQARRIKGLAR